MKIYLVFGPDIQQEGKGMSGSARTAQDKGDPIDGRRI